MSDHQAAPANCAACAFWRRLRENEGVCTRHAPQTSIHPEEAAHWPQTRSWQWCGEGVAAEALSIGAHCAACIYWRHPEGGTPSGQPRRHAHGVVGACRNLRPPCALSGFGARTESVLARNAGYGLLRRGPAAQSSRAVVGHLETIDAAGAWQASGGAVAQPPRFRHMRPETLDRALAAYCTHKTLNLG